jgi:hypothetical protein
MAGSLSRGARIGGLGLAVGTGSCGRRGGAGGGGRGEVRGGGGGGAGGQAEQVALREA